MSDDIFHSFLGKGVALAFALLPLAPLLVLPPAVPPVKNMVLAPDAFADVTNWPKFIPITKEPDLALASPTRMGEAQGILPDLPRGRVAEEDAEGMPREIARFLQRFSPLPHKEE